MTRNWFYTFKHMLVAETRLSDPVLHVLIGLAIFLVFYVLSRSPWRAFSVLALIQAANELNDYTVKGGRGLALFLTDSAFDSLWTMALPLGLAVLVSIMPGRSKK